MKRVVTLGFVFVMLAGCSKDPYDRTRDGSGGGALGRLGVISNLVVFSNELKTGGGAFEYPGGQNQVLDFADTSNPISARSIRYVWNGSPAQAGSTDHTFAGFDLMHTTSLTDYSTTVGRDLRAAGYTKVTFYARGALSTNTTLKIEVADDGNTGTASPCLTLSTNGTDNACTAGPLTLTPRQLTSSWQQYTLTFPTSSLAAVKDFFKATFVFTDPFVGNQNPGQGGTVYFDQIQYEP